MITQALLKEWLHYDPETGKFHWLQVTSNRVKIGQEAGWITITGHIDIGLFGTNYRAHRLAWLYMTGKWPNREIDHKDLATWNNKWDNLREATKSQQRMNERLKANNTTGYKGVSKHKSGKWQANIRNHYLGLYDTPEKAHEAYWQAAQKLFGQFARKD